MTERARIDALLDAYAARGAVILRTLALVEQVLDPQLVAHPGQVPVQDFAREVRAALQEHAPARACALLDRHRAHLWLHGPEAGSAYCNGRPAAPSPVRPFKEPRR
ncbi:hypothetical protein [Streptomyces sp. NPDC096153]|uniref:hypothetical protein n=1 Tax=Streptomyces sp. NPDC096153 TaxID=3155548 RepID=UPI00331F4731